MNDRSTTNNLGEGDTPLVSLRRTAGELGLRSLWAKLEFMSPTGSFKDRSSAVLTTMGRDFGVTEFVQAHAVSPAVAALNGEDWLHEDVKPTRASGIAVSKPPRLAEMVEAIGATKGTSLTISEDSLTVWQKRLASSEGIFAEMTSASALAGLEKLIDSGTIQRGATVCVPITGSGLKEPLRR